MNYLGSILSMSSSFTHATLHDHEKLRQTTRALRRHASSRRRLQRETDNQQDRRLASLEQENDDLRLMLAHLLALLQDKSLLTAEDLKLVAGGLEEITDPGEDDAGA